MTPRRSNSWRTRIHLLAVLALASTACNGIGADKPEIGPADPIDTSVSGDVVVLGASSLTESFTEVARRFEARYPAANVVTSFASSATLVAQIGAGAPADVVATADELKMGDLTALGAVASGTNFAANRLEIAVLDGNPAGITELTDLTADDLLVAACISAAPCGTLADAVLAEAGVTIEFVTREPNVKATLTKLTLGEVDAALVYRTDIDQTNATGVPIESGLRNRAAIAVATDASNPDAARAFVDFVLGSDGRAVFDEFGFDRP